MSFHPDFKQPLKKSTENDKRCAEARCTFASIPGTDYCPLHQPKNADLYAFKKTEIAANLHKMRNHQDFHTLEVEIGLIRYLLESYVNSCETHLDLMRNSGQMLQLVDRINGLLKSNIQVGQITGELMSKEQVVTIAQQMVTIISDYLTEDELGEVLGKFGEIFDNVQ